MDDGSRQRPTPPQSGSARPVEAMTLMGWKQQLDFQDKARRIAKTLNPPGNRVGAQVHNADGTISTHATAGCTGCHR